MCWDTHCNVSSYVPTNRTSVVEGMPIQTGDKEGLKRLIKKKRITDNAVKDICDSYSIF